MRTTIRKCVGFGPTEGRCTNTAGTAWSPYWCESCDKARREHITRRLEEMAAVPHTCGEPQ